MTFELIVNLINSRCFCFRCCYDHDDCYNYIRTKYNKNKFQILVESFSYDCQYDERRVTCGNKIVAYLKIRVHFLLNFILCLDDNDEWERELCECDRICAECFVKNKRYFDSKKKLSHSKGLCKNS